MAEGLLSAGPPSSVSVQVANGVEHATPAPHRPPLERPLMAIRRYKWLVVAVVLVSTIVGLIGTRFITPQYDVRATVWIATETRSGGDRVGPIRSAELLNSTAWIELFKSYRIVDAVVRSLALYLRPANMADAPAFAGFTLADRFVPGVYELEIDRRRGTWILRNAADIVVGRGKAADSVGTKVGFHWLLPDSLFHGPGKRTISFTLATPRETSIEILKRLESRLQMGSNFLWLTYHDPDPILAARTMNTWLGEFISVAADLKKRNVVEFANILAGQLQYAEKATQDAETEYQRFRVNTITLPTEGGPMAAGLEATRDPALQSYFEQKIQYDNLRHDREALEKSIANAASGSVPYEGLLLIPSVAQSPGAEALREAFKTLYATRARLSVERQSFTDEYPTVKELKRNIEVLQGQTIPQLSTQLLMQLRERESDYQRRIAGASRELQAIPPRTIEETRLKRAVTVAEALYTNLKSRYAEAQLAAASATPDISVLDTAIAPLSPTTNTAPRILLVAVVGGLAVAIGLAILLDTMDHRVRYSDQISTELGLPIAGAIPRIPKGGINASSPEQVVQFVESFRSLRMHVMHSAPGRRITLAVTSAAPGDGKSLISANLALSFAEAGLRTVLIDGDTRRGSLHKMFGFGAAGGLTDYLSGAIAEGDATRKTSHDNLYFVSCGRRNQRSPELLASIQLKKFVSHLSETFEVVIFDTPPLAAGIDGFAISAATGNILMVLRIGQTERRLASAKLAVLDRLPVEVLGAVLNGVSTTGEFQYYAYTAGYSIDGGDSIGELVASSK